MNRALWFFVAAVSGCAVPQATDVSAPVATSAEATADTDSRSTAAASVEELGKQVVEHLAGGRPELVTARFDAAAQAAMSPKQLGDTWASLVAQVGDLQRIDTPVSSNKQGYDVVDVTATFAKAAMSIRIVFDADRRIAGLTIRAAPPTTPYAPPSYAQLAALSEHEVTVGSGQWALPGTLTVPKDVRSDCPAVVLVHGSGPNDRDESVGANKPFRDLALGLASRGICVLRYDKRTLTHGPALGAALGDDLTLKQETIDDVIAAVELLRSRSDIDEDRIFVLGHSLGGTAIPRIAQQDPNIGGFIILAGATVPLEDAILRQLRYVSELDGTISDREKAVLAKLAAQVATVKQLTASSTSSVAPQDLPLGIPAPYWLDLAAHRSSLAMTGDSRPILVLQGDRDYQVTGEDFAGWKKALSGKKAASFKRYPALNHLFIAGEGKSSPPEYLQPGHVAQQVVDDIARWIKKR